MRYPDDVLFCAKYLKDRGFLAKEVLDQMQESIDTFTVKYELTKVNNGFIPELAKKLRELWPTGENASGYAWRDTEENLIERLEFIWKKRHLGDKYTLEDCLSVARRYLARFEESTKYMKLVKYFIFKKEKSGVGADGKILYTYTSIFADMLENSPINQEEPDFSNLFSEGTII